MDMPGWISIQHACGCTHLYRQRAGCPIPPDRVETLAGNECPDCLSRWHEALANAYEAINQRFLDYGDPCYYDL